MKKIFKQYDTFTFKPNKSGSDKVDVFETVETDKGFVYKKTGTVNRQAIMNSEAKNTDIAILYKRLIHGDNTVLNTREGVFLDNTNSPKDIYEMNNYSKFIEKYFNENELLQKVYKGDFDSYFVDYSNGIDSIRSKIEAYTSKIIDSMNKKIIKTEIKKEVKENENK